MIRGPKCLLPALFAGMVLLAAPVLAQVQSQPLPPPAGTPQAPPSTTTPSTTPPSTTTPPATPPATKTEAPKTPTPMTKPAPKPGQAPPPPRNTCPDEKVDINAAPVETLKKLPQIGVQRSNSIIKARPYATPEDLMKKKVLKKAVYEKIKSCITASGVAAGTTPATTKGTPPANTKGPATKPAATTPVPVPAPTTQTAPKAQQ